MMRRMIPIIGLRSMPIPPPPIGGIQAAEDVQVGIDALLDEPDRRPQRHDVGDRAEHLDPAEDDRA